MVKDGLFQKEDLCCLRLVTKEEIKHLNKKYRGNNEVTDILTFPSEHKESHFIGDMIIAPQIVIENSISFETVFIHGLLHLAGFDHISNKDKEKMAIYEDKYALK